MQKLLVFSLVIHSLLTPTSLWDFLNFILSPLTESKLLLLLFLLPSYPHKNMNNVEEKTRTGYNSKTFL